MLLRLFADGASVANAAWGLVSLENGSDLVKSRWKTPMSAMTSQLPGQ
jgi:hypothetical protein